MTPTLSLNPATGEEIGRTPENTVEDIRRSVELARVAQREWGGYSFRRRAQHVRRIRDFIVANADRIAGIISRDSGKTRLDALSTEVIPGAMAASYYARVASRVLRPHRVMPGNILFVNKSARIERAPFGVVGIISPWNYPFSIPLHEVLMALMAGNGVVLKAATQTQEVGKVLAECITAGTLPEGLCSVLNVPGAVAGPAFLEAGIQKLWFTGSVAVGKKLMEEASKRLVPVSLELGGNDAMIVCNDADAYRAAAGAAWAGYSNAGQSCGGVERIYVEDGIYDEFVRELKSRIESLRVGPDRDGNVDIGSLTTKHQLETVRGHVEDALTKGATASAVANHMVNAGGGMFYPPTVLEKATPDMVTMKEETFGPVVGVTKVRSVDEAVGLANDSMLGLTASVWSRNRHAARRIASRLEVGTVTINDHLMSHGLAELPWGGWKESGIGRTHGAYGLEEMTQPRVVVDDWLPFVKRNMWWYPHSPEVYAGLRGVLQTLYGKGIVTRCVGLVALAKTFARTFTKH